MRPHFSRSFAAHHRPPRADEAATERAVAEALLGAGHPLVVLLGRSEVAFEQLVWVTAVEAAGLVHFAGGWAFGLSLAIAAAVVQLGVGCRLAALGAARRDVCLELIVEGHGALPLACIERLRRRLLERRARERLARSIEEMVATAARPRPGAPPPLAASRVIRATAAELGELARLLRGDPAAEGVALVELLLTSGATPLYGSEVEPLRQELRRALYLLSSCGEGVERPASAHGGS
jgi:hypothetical protein